MRSRGAAAGAVVCALVLAMSSSAFAHVERTSYWPDPAPDTSVHPAAGGAVPKARSLASALNDSAPWRTRVVCQADSLKLARADIASARTAGYRDRPTEPLRHLSATGAKRLLSVNRSLCRRCSYREIQPAITASHNNDRVVIMPGTYTEPESRRVP